MLEGYQKLLDDAETRDAAASSFVSYELNISKVHRNQEGIAKALANPALLIPFASLEVIYMLANGFLEEGEEFVVIVVVVCCLFVVCCLLFVVCLFVLCCFVLLLFLILFLIFLLIIFLLGQLIKPENLSLMKNMNVSIVHGRNDHVCLPTAAWRFHNGLLAAGVNTRLWFVIIILLFYYFSVFQFFFFFFFFFRFVDGNGHSDSEPGIGGALKAEADRIGKA